MNDEVSHLQGFSVNYRPAKPFHGLFCALHGFGKQFFDCGFEQRRMRTPLKDPTNAPVAINQHDTRNPSRPKFSADTSVSHQDIEGVTVALYERGDIGVAGVFDGVEVDTQNTKLVGGEALVKRLHMGHRLSARATEDRPKIEHHHFSPLRRQIHGTTIAQQPE